MGKKDKQNAAESTPEKNTAQQPTADEAAKTAETAKADETAEKSAEPETFTVTREQMEKMEGLAKSLADEQDKYLRLAAEYDNYRKRTAKEKEGLYADAKIERSRRCWAFTITSSAALPSTATRSRPTARALKWCSTSSKRASKSWVLKRWTPWVSPLTLKSTTP